MIPSLQDIPALIIIAPRIIWFESPDHALSDPFRFLAYAMRYATHEDMTTIRNYISDENFAATLAA